MQFIVSIVLLIVCLALNIHLYRLEYQPNHAEKISMGRCLEGELFQTWRIVSAWHLNSYKNKGFYLKSKFYFKVHSYIYSIIPFGLLIIFNSLLLHHVIISFKTRSKIIPIGYVKHLSKGKSITILIITLTFAFIILTAPFAIGG